MADAGLGSDHGTRPDRDVSGSAGLTGEIDVVTDDRAAGETDLSAEDAMLPNYAVVPDLDEVVDLRPLPYPGSAEGCPVYRRIGADLDVIADRDVADLRNLQLLSAFRQIAKSIGSDHGSGMDRDPIPDDGLGIDRHIGKEMTVLAQAHILPKIAACFDDAAFADLAAGGDHGISADGHFAGDIDVICDHGSRIDPVNAIRSLQPEPDADQDHEAEIGLVANEQVSPGQLFRMMSSANDQARPGGDDRLQIFILLDKHHARGIGTIRIGNRGKDQAMFAGKLSADQTDDLFGA